MQSLLKQISYERSLTWPELLLIYAPVDGDSASYGVCAGLVRDRGTVRSENDAHEFIVAFHHRWPYHEISVQLGDKRVES